MVRYLVPRSASDTAGELPSRKPAGKSIWITPGGDLGAVASETIVRYGDAWSVQPASFNALKGRSVMGVIPAGSTEPGGGGGGTATTLSPALPLWLSLVAVI